MDITSILVPCGKDLRSSAGLETAIAVAHLTGGRITGLHCPTEAALPWYVGAPVAIPPAPDMSSAEAEQSFIARCSAACLSCDWVVDQGSLPERLAFYSRYADLIVAGRGGGDGGGLSPRALGQLVLSASAPLLVVPPGPEGPFQPRRVLVAWNERREAGRALHGALPFLRRAKETILLTVHPPGFDDAPDRRALAYLEAHHIRADARINFATAFEAPGAILAQARVLEVDLLVMGAYGHARVFEQALGGATQQVLETAELPVLMVH
ncbi:universal stress protein [Azospirillum rugosum]|uniref:Nucleotide-binding universal stress UspA family protein n=1 Tax=Azospirillum rugosum TaxID=416170 RepID=A0ABS4SWC2_9PROT|nr:universal stress protein [Azospirillum rugosum]MBP2296772.1 nucleotide-binding universal stress UspA family protein [Azospirillum rugosum]MDQ0530375.1 nucleotide-binding universal stress UspA family protein [Azospirillum rugosum]